MLTPNMLIHHRYRIVRHIAGGGMGNVYQATDERLGHTVALKQLLLTDPAAQHAFEREAKLLAPLHHPAIPTVSDYFSDPAGQFLVMRYIPGDDLGTMLQQRGQPFAVADGLRWADQLLDVLAYLHKQGIIHRDIKPQNLKLDSEGTLMLLDFGIAKHTGNSSMLAATPGYAPIEQLQGLGTDPRSDLYALGATLYSLLTAWQPPSSVTRLVATSQQQPDPLVPAHQRNPQVPPAVSAVLLHALAIHAPHRPPDAPTMRQMLRDAQAGHAPASPAYATPPAPPARTFPVLAVVVAVLLLALGAGGAYWYATGGAVGNERTATTGGQVAAETATNTPPDDALAPTATVVAPPTSPASLGATQTALAATQTTTAGEAETQAQRSTQAALQQTSEALAATAQTLAQTQTARVATAPPPATPPVPNTAGGGNLPPVGVGRGMQIIELTPGSPAAQAGMTVGEVILSIDNRAVSTADDVRTVAAQNQGASVPVLLFDGQQQYTVMLDVVEPLIGVVLCDVGVCLAAPGTAPAQAAAPSPAYGMQIIAIDPASPAARAGLAVGQILLELDGRPIYTVADARAVVAQNQGRTVNATLRFGSETFVVPVLLDATPLGVDLCALNACP